MAEDYEHYVCKYTTGTPANKLLIEYLGYRFAQLWHIPIPIAAFVNIEAEHIPDWIVREGIQKRYFNMPCIGSRYIQDSNEINNMTIASWQTKKSQIKKIQNKPDILKIGLFDTWLANEDRLGNNYNLLVAATENGEQLMAIDHEKCFNSGMAPQHPIYQVNESESILCTELPDTLLPNKEQLQRLANELLEEFPIFVEKCRNKVPQILAEIPQQWGINGQAIEEYLNQNIFSEIWLTETKNNFREFLNLE